MIARTFSPAHRRRLIADEMWAIEESLGDLRARIHDALDQDGNSMPSEQLWELRQIDGDAQSYRAELARQGHEMEASL